MDVAIVHIMQLGQNSVPLAVTTHVFRHKIGELVAAPFTCMTIAGRMVSGAILGIAVPVMSVDVIFHHVAMGYNKVGMSPH